jgi:hypothetical protein
VPVNKDRKKADLRGFSWSAIKRGTNAIHARKAQSNAGKARISKSTEQRTLRRSLLFITRVMTSAVEGENGRARSAPNENASDSLRLAIAASWAALVYG